MTLDHIYRRLMACYPRAYRRQYEDEMVGVLLDDAAPGQRRPAARDVLALLGGALRAHVRQAGARFSADPWREAAQALALIAALTLFVRAARVPVLHLAMLAESYPVGIGEPVVLWPGGPVSVLWLIVAVLAVVGWARAGAAVAVCGAAFEVVRVAADYGQYSTVFHLWPAVLAAMVPLALAVRAPRSAAAALARWRLGTLVAATLVSVAAPSVAQVTGADNDTAPIYGTWIFTSGVGRIEAILLTAGYLLFALAILSAPAVLRRRLLALVVPVGVTLLLTRVGFGATGTFLKRSTHDGVLAALTPAQWLVLVLTPTLFFAVAVAILHHRERPGRRGA
ncbi:hypothetical protein [Micromonospora ureilytica]|uniref:Uncharacterized protein n=1 Tax=Micromonospora ureilytica TaxID=709868 RepID=A0ABS0JPR8_9ACTN|nr:hypothetical protein [Micromonospora ureilytica]MBG6069048.1 hypothetical protein [Micromonospora ureilytica]WSR57603.1 hypothetical protein OG400_05150 [Micromonospora ureilytica]